jgi:FkbM family methyltransferase
MSDQLNERPEIVRKSEEDQIFFEEFMERYFEDRNGLSFIQIGANDGLMHDPIHAYIVENNWTGVLVEPQKEEYQKLLKTYKGNQLLSFENVGITEKEGKTDLYKLDKDYILSRKETGATYQELTGIASLDKEGSELGSDWVDKEHIVSERISTTTLEKIISKYNIRHLDLLQIDTEGYDGKIIKQVDLEILRPRVIQFEHKFVPENERREAKELLLNAGYKIKSLNYNTLAWLGSSSNEEEPLSLRKISSGR